MLHTGDISHLSKPEEFDAVAQILQSAKAKDVFYVPGEHDVLNDDGKQYLERYGKGSKGNGWYSFDKKGVHFVGLVNVMNLKAGGLGTLGSEQLEWLEDDVKALNVEHADCGVRAHSAVDGVSGVGMGNGRQRAGAGVSEEVWFGDGAERAHPPDHAKGGRKRDVSHRMFDGVSAARAGHSAFAGADESAGGAIAECAGNYRREVCARAACAGSGGFFARLKPELQRIAVVSKIQF